MNGIVGHSHPVLEVANNCTLRQLSNRQNVADGELSLLASVDELSSVHTLSRDEKLLVKLEVVGRPELDDRKGGTPTGVVDDLLHDTLPDLNVSDGAKPCTNIGCTK